MPKLWSKISLNWRNWSTPCKRLNSFSRSKTRSKSTSTESKTKWRLKKPDWAPQWAACILDLWPGSFRENACPPLRRCCGGLAEETYFCAEPKSTNRSLIRCSEAAKSGKQFSWFSSREISWRFESKKSARDFAPLSTLVLSRLLTKAYVMNALKSTNIIFVIL